MARRPTAVTALAVVNFAFAAILFPVYFAGLLTMPAEVGQTTALAHLVVLFGLVTAVLMVASGVGLLQQRRFLGQTLGNTWATIAVANSALLFAIDSRAFLSTPLLLVLGCAYPIAVLVLINTSYKSSFIH